MEVCDFGCLRHLVVESAGGHFQVQEYEFWSYETLCVHVEGDALKGMMEQYIRNPMEAAKRNLQELLE